MNLLETRGNPAPIKFTEGQVPIFVPATQSCPPRTATEDFAKTQATRGGHGVLLCVDRNIKARSTRAVKC